MSKVPIAIDSSSASGLRRVTESLIKLLKDTDYDDVRRNALAKRLELLAKLSDEIDKSSQGALQLRELQGLMESLDISRSRPSRVSTNQRSLAIWNKINDTINQTMDRAMFDLVAQTHQTQTTQHVSRVTGPQLMVVDAYQITHQGEILQNTQRDVNRYSTVSLHSGRIGGMSVVYQTFGDSQYLPHDIVEKDLRLLTRYLHVNVAKFVGVTKTYAGLSGFVCAMDGLPFLVFASKAHSGAVWARCIRGFQDVVVSGPKSPYAQHITVAHNGHVTILPGRPGSMYIDLAAAWFSNRRPQSDPAVNVLIRVYAANHPRIGPNQLRTFIDSLNGLRHGFTELDIIKVAAICRLFPPPKIHFFTSTSNRLPPFQPEVGEFGRASYRNGQLVAWESLGFSRKIQRMNLNGKALFSGSLNWSASLAPSGNYWLTYALSKPFSHHGRGSIFADSWSCEKRLDESHRILWEDIFTEGQEMSQRSNVDLDDISFCYKICCDARFRRPSNAEFRELPASLYYHRSISSSNQYDTQGFFGVDKTPDSGLWHQRLKERGWELNFVLNIRTYNLHDDWGRRYERKLEQGLAAIPGSYPSAWVEEIL